MANKQIDETLQNRNLCLRLTLLTWATLSATAFAIAYLLAPGLALLHPVLPNLAYVLAAAGVIFSGGLIASIGVALETHHELPLGILRSASKAVYIFLPYCILWGKVFRIPKEHVAQSLVDLINTLSERYLTKLKPADIMLLTPHCLQNDTCPIKVTRDAFACRECGRCPVGGLVHLAKTYGVSLYIATGGTFARLLVKKHRPKAIIAIACERDLVLGMRDVFPILVFGVLNSRPYGPCFNTQVDLQKVDKVLAHLLGEKKSVENCSRNSARRLA